MFPMVLHGMSTEDVPSLITVSIDLPILPIPALDSLQPTLFTFHRQLLSLQPIPTALHTLTDILPHCSAGGPLKKHTVNVLSDVCSGLRGLAVAATTTEGIEGLRGYLDEMQARDVVEFWETEYVAD
jgi:hypothetical protein